MKELNFYTTAHLIVSAVRIIEHQTNAPPTVDDVRKMLSFSPEQVSFACHRMHEMGILEAVEGAFGIRLSICDHLKMEDIPRQDTEDRLDKELKKFKNSRTDYEQKVKTIQAEHREKKKSLFSELEKQFKKGLEKNN